MESNKKIKVKLYRSPSIEKEDPNGEGDYKDYEIPYKDRMTIMNVCDYIQNNIDRTLAFYKSCRIGKCTGCIMEINGKAKIACTTLVEDNMTIGPAKGKKIIRDLLVEI